jgi:hypothetical protein
MLFRDLARNVRYLTGSDRDEAERNLARPDDGGADPNGLGYSVASKSACSINFCVHWVETTSDAPPLTDADATGLPDWVETTTAILEDVRSTEVSTLGYRAPKPDATSVNHGPDGRIDVYLVDIGPTYGITISDDPQSADPNYPYWDSSVYLVLDNDFSATQFPGAYGFPALEVTVAHEFFHAVQAAYDWYEDGRLMESTATWMEEEVDDNINDNRQYLGSSPLRQPFVPMDLGNPARSNLYGDWIFWEFLTGYFGGNQPDLSVVQRVWQLADGSAGGPDYYSTAAIDQMAAERDSSFRFAFADFAAANALPKVYYEEGGSYPAPRFKSFALTANKPRLGPAGVRLDHLTSAYVSLSQAPESRELRSSWLQSTFPPARRGPKQPFVQMEGRRSEVHRHEAQRSREWKCESPVWPRTSLPGGTGAHQRKRPFQLLAPHVVLMPRAPSGRSGRLRVCGRGSRLGRECLGT